MTWDPAAECSSLLPLFGLCTAKATFVRTRHYNHFAVSYLGSDRCKARQAEGKAQKIYIADESFAIATSTESKASIVPEFVLARHNLGTVDSFCGISRIHHQLRLGNDATIVVVGVVGDDQHAIILAEILQLRALHL